MKINNGIIASVQGLDINFTNYIIDECINAGVVAFRVDKPVKKIKLPIIGLKKISVPNLKNNAYITPDICYIKQVKDWCNYVAVDFRTLNNNLDDINEYCIANNIKIVADIGTYEDYINIVNKKYTVSYITTALAVYYTQKRHYPDINLVDKICKTNYSNLIAEGDYKTRADTTKALALCGKVCIGKAICDVYTLAEKFVSCTESWKEKNYTKKGA